MNGNLKKILQLVQIIFWGYGHSYSPVVGNYSLRIRAAKKPRFLKFRFLGFYVQRPDTKVRPKST